MGRKKLGCVTSFLILAKPFAPHNAALGVPTKVMAYTKCSKCGESFHLKMNSSEGITQLRTKEQNKDVLCLGCFKTKKEFDVVQVIAKNSSVPEANIGDTGAIVMVHNNGEAYEVECLASNGKTKWLGTFTNEQIKWLQTPN